MHLKNDLISKGSVKDLLLVTNEIYVFCQYKKNMECKTRLIEG